MSKLREILKRKRMTQRELAESTGLTETYINYYINGKRGMNVDNAKKIAKALNIKVDDFI